MDSTEPICLSSINNQKLIRQLGAVNSCVKAKIDNYSKLTFAILA